MTTGASVAHNVAVCLVEGVQVGKGEQVHPRRSWLFRLSGWVPDVIVAVCLLLALVQTQYDVAGRVGLVADPATEPAAVAPPAGVQVPEQPAATPVAAGAHAEPDAAAVRRAVARIVPHRNFGKRTVALVTDLSGRELFRHGTAAITPASNTKLVSTAAALEVLGPDARFRTTVRRVGTSPTIFLVGGGDPYLASKPVRKSYPPRATIVDLAQRTAAGLRESGTARVRLKYDDSLFTGPAVNPFWPETYIPEMVVPPISALWVDQGSKPDGWGYVDDPAASAASQFAKALRAQGIRVNPTIERGKAPTTATDLAHVTSAPLSSIVHRIVSASDNNAAEVVLRHLGVASGDGSSAGGARAALETLAALGADVSGAVIHDGSGLSRENRLSASTLVDVLRLAASPAHPELRSVITGLSVAGFEGSLSNRFDRTDPAARGRVIAKTGTLTGVHGLAGIATDRTGAPMVFAILTDGVKPEKTLAARLQLDRFAAALGACRCAVAP